MGRRLLTRFATAAATALAAGLLFSAADRLASRPDRVRRAAAVDGLLSARDAVLEYEHDLGRLPPRLEDLVPRYLRADQLASGGRALYAYDPEGRTIAMAAPFAVRGLVGGLVPPVEMDLPEPDPAARARPLPPAAPMSTVVPSGPELAPPREGVYILEAEDYSETNYGWEVHLDPDAAGGAYIHSKEGVANGPGQTLCGVFDFYNVREKREFTYLKYHFRLPKGGRYYVSGRFWTTGSHCSNAIALGVDEGGPRPRRFGHDTGYYGGIMSNRTPFRWVWTPVSGGARNLEAGDHYLHLFLHEDGVRLDQIALAPVPGVGSRAYAANLLPNEGTAFRAASASPVHISFDLKSMVMTDGAAPEASVAVRRIAPDDRRAELRVVMECAAPGGRDLDLGVATLELKDLPELAFFPVDFSALGQVPLPRREFLLRAELVSGGERLAECHVPFMRPFAWEVAGPGRYYSNSMPGPLDADLEREGVGWKPFADANWDHFGVMDFGLQYGGNSLHAPQLKTAYARTRVLVPKTGEYLLKIQSDDQMLLWIDGELVYRHDDQAPVTRSVKRLKLVLERGERRVRFRVNQRAFSEYGDGRWQASLRFRTPEDELSDVRGVDPPGGAAP